MLGSKSSAGAAGDPALISIAIPAIETEPGGAMTMMQRSIREPSQVGRLAAFLYGLTAYVGLLSSPFCMPSALWRAWWCPRASTPEPLLR